MKKVRVVMTVLALAATPLAAALGTANASTARPMPAGSVTVAKAAPSVTNETLCDNAGDSDNCLAPSAGGPPYLGETVTTTSSGLQLNEDTIGTVSSTGPFSTGSNCDSRYEGHTYVYLAWTNAPGEYLRNDNSDGDLIVISATQDKASEWVKSGYWYINVAATDDAGVDCSTQNPYLLTWRPNTGDVWSACGGCYDYAKQNWATAP